MAGWWASAGELWATPSSGWSCLYLDSYRRGRWEQEGDMAPGTRRGRNRKKQEQKCKAPIKQGWAVNQGDWQPSLGLFVLPASAPVLCGSWPREQGWGSCRNPIFNRIWEKGPINQGGSFTVSEETNLSSRHTQVGDKTSPPGPGSNFPGPEAAALQECNLAQSRS